MNQEQLTVAEAVLVAQHVNKQVSKTELAEIPSAPCCAGCLYFFLTDKAQRAGECHCNPPVPIDKTGRISGASWPGVSQSSWCGRFKAKRA
jgi:hypothetical protein